MTTICDHANEDGLRLQPLPACLAPTDADRTANPGLTLPQTGDAVVINGGHVLFLMLLSVYHGLAPVSEATSILIGAPMTDQGCGAARWDPDSLIPCVPGPELDEDVSASIQAAWHLLIDLASQHDTAATATGADPAPHCAARPVGPDRPGGCDDDASQRSVRACGEPVSLTLPIISTRYEPTSIPTHATLTHRGLEFTFDPNHLGITGKITVVADGPEITRIELGGPDRHDGLEVGDWGFAEMRIEAGSTDTLADIDLDEETRDTLRSLIYSLIGYTQGHGARAAGRLGPGERTPTRHTTDPSGL